MLENMVTLLHLPTRRGGAYGADRCISPLKDCKQCLLLWLSDNYYFLSFSVAGHNVVPVYLVCLHYFKYLLEQSSVFVM